MGITGLLKGLEPYKRKGSVREFKGQSLAVDASSWLHKSVYSISEHYVEAVEQGRIDSKCVDVSANYILKRCQELLGFAGIAKIWLVMDGKRCPLKAGENHERDKKRQANLQEARLHKNHHRKKESEMKYNACIKVGEDLTKKVMEKVNHFCRRRKLNVEFVQSPYEADAQMAKLCMDGATDAIVTEDSDVLVYLAACHLSTPILYKLERQTGACDIISMEWLLQGSKASDSAIIPDTRNAKGKEKSKSKPGMDPMLKSMAFRETVNPGRGVRLFVQACVLSGCDYAPNLLSGVGLVTAFKAVRDNSHLLPEELFMVVLSGLRKKLPTDVDIQQYKETLSKSEAVFYYHPVTNANGKTVTLLGRMDESTASCQTNKYTPALNLFNGDLSFLGNEECLTGSTARNKKPPGAEMVIPATAKRIANTIESLSAKPILQNSDDRVGKARNSKSRLSNAAFGKKHSKDTGAGEIRGRDNSPPPKRASLGSLAQFAFTDKENRHDVRMGKRNMSKVTLQQKSEIPTNLAMATTRHQNTLATTAPTWRDTLSLSQTQPIKHEKNSSDPETVQKAVLQSPGSSDSGSIASPPARPAGTFRAVTSMHNSLGTSHTAVDYGTTAATLKGRNRFALPQQRRPHEMLKKAPPQRIQNPYGQKRFLLALPVVAKASNTEKQTSTVSKFFSSTPRTKSKTQARRVTLENLPKHIGNARGDDCIDLTDDGTNLGPSKNRLSPKDPPLFDYGETNRSSINNAAKQTRNDGNMDSWGSSDEVDSPDGSSKLSGLLSRTAVKPGPVTKVRLPPYRNPKKHPKQGPLARAFETQQKSFSHDSPGSISSTNAVKELVSRSASRPRPVQPKAKKQKTMNSFLSNRVIEREVDDF